MKKAGISLKKQLLIIFLFIAFIPMTVTALLLYHFQTQNALNAEIESQIQVLKLVTSNIYQKLTYFNNLTASIYYNDDIMSCLEKGQATLLSSPDKKRIQPAIDSLMRTDDMILSVSLTTMAGDTLYWNDGYSNAIHINSLDPDFLQKIYAHNGSGVLSNPITHTSKRKYPASNTSIYYGRLLRSLTHNFRPIGILLVEVDIASFEDIVNADTIAIGDPASVPAGQYAQEALTSLGIYDELNAAGKFSLGTNVTEVLNWVAEGSADVGIVYATDAATTENVKIIAEAPEGSLAAPVIYPVGMIADSAHQEAAQLFIDFLQSDEALAVFEAYGFARNI